MLTRSLRVAALLVALTLLPAAAHAKKTATAANTTGPALRLTADEPEVYRAISIDLMEAACKQMDLKPKRDKDNDGDPCLILDYDGVKAVLLFYGDATKSSSLALQASWETEEGADMELANTWNRERRFTRAYTRDKDYVLESDLDLEGGVTSETVGRWVGMFKTATAQFIEHVKGDGAVG